MICNKKSLLIRKRMIFFIDVFIVHFIIFIGFYLILDKVLNLPEYFNDIIFQTQMLTTPIIFYFIGACFVVYAIEFIFMKILMRKIDRYVDGKYKENDRKFIVELRRDCMKAPYKFMTIQIVVSVVILLVTLIIDFFCFKIFVGNFDKLLISIIRVELLVVAVWLLLTIFEYILLQVYVNSILFSSYDNNYFYVKNDKTISNSSFILSQIIPIIFTIFIIFANISYTNTVNAYSKAIGSYYNINMSELDYKGEAVYAETVLADAMEKVPKWEEDNKYFVIDWSGNIIESYKGTVSNFMLKYLTKFYYFTEDENGNRILDLEKKSGIIYSSFGIDDHAFVKMIKDSFGRKMFLGVKYYAGSKETFENLMYSSIIMFIVYSVIIVYWSRLIASNMKKIESTMEKNLFKEKDILNKNFMPILSNDELGNISYYYNKIQEKLIMQTEVMMKQGQLYTLGELAGNVAHDINTPISSIDTSILMLKKGAKTERDIEILDNMKVSTDKIIEIVNSMRNQIRNLGSDRKESFILNQVVNDIHILTQNEQVKNGCTFSSEIREEIKIFGDKTKLGQVLTNIVINGIQAYFQNEKRGEVKLKAFKKDNIICRIEIEDNAGGIPEKFQKYLFKNIMTTKGSKGTGLGLYMASSIITGIYNGKIWFEVRKGIGTTFIIEVPMIGED